MLAKLKKEMHQSYFVVAFAIGIIIGTVLVLIFRFNFFSSSIWVLFSIMILLISYFKPKIIFIIIVLIAGMILAFFRSAKELEGEKYIRQFYEQKVLITGKVDGDPESDEGGTSIKLKELMFGEEEIKTAGNIFISARYNSDISRGDLIVVYGKLTEGFGTYVGYMYRPTIKSIMKPEPGDLVLRVRDWFAERIKRNIMEPEVNLGLSYLLGMKTGLPEDLAENLRIVGLVHIVVASGAHLSILVTVARKIFGKISRFFGLLFSILFILLFMAMVGFTPSILRAGIMSILNLLIWYVGRDIKPWRMILLVMAMTLLMNPMFLINLGWLLSFASFSGIMILGPSLTRFFYGEDKPGFFGSTILTTISATIMTLPITLYFYGTVSLISVIANLIILPTLPYAMGLVFFSGLVFGIPIIETIIAFLTTRLLGFHILVVELFGKMRSFLVQIPTNRREVFIIYIIMIIVIMILQIRKKMVKLRKL